MFELKFETDNDCFQSPEYGREEVCNILEHIAALFGDGRDDGPISDVNGNSIGTWKFTA